MQEESGSGDPGVGAGRAGRCTRLPANRRACAAARPAPAELGIRVGGGAPPGFGAYASLNAGGTPASPVPR